MSQDTRKDKRAKIVSLNVRYKSATVDEFIENHSHDVSKGGIFIKTPTPFPPGTLLKFEIRIAGDKAVIAGVGRVVWKREPTQAASERPAGMGVKFIKIDDSSRVVIDKLVGTRSDAGSAFEATDVEALRTSAPPAGPAGSEQTTTLSGPPPTQSGPPAPAPIPAPTPAAGAPPPRPEQKLKSTIMGVGTLPSSPPAAKTVSAAPPKKADAMFPTSVSSEEDVPKEATMMKQAAELLEEALKEAGGSLDEIGQNPLFDRAPKPAPHKPERTAMVPTLGAPAVPSAPTTLKGLPVAAPVEGATAAQPETSKATAQEEPELPKIDTSLERPLPLPSPVRTSAPPKASSTPPVQASTPPVRSSAPVPRSDAPRPVSARDAVASKRKGGSLGIIIGLILVAGVAGAAVYVVKPELFGMAPPPAPTDSAPPPPATLTIPPVVPPPPIAVVDAAVATATDAATAAVDAGRVKDAGGATIATGTTTATATPRPRPRPTATATATATTPTEPTTTAEPPTTPTATATATATAAPTATATATATATDTAPAPVKPPSNRRPKPTDSDNPY